MGIHCLLLPSPKHFKKNKNVEEGEYSSASWVFAELLLSLPSTPTCGNNHRVRAASMWPERRIPRPKKKKEGITVLNAARSPFLQFTFLSIYIFFNLGFDIQTARGNCLQRLTNTETLNIVPASLLSLCVLSPSLMSL